MEWPGIWNCILLGSEVSTFGARNLVKIGLSAGFQEFSCYLRALKVYLGLCKVAIPYATHPYPHKVPVDLLAFGTTFTPVVDTETL